MAEEHYKRRVFFLLDSFNVGGTESQAVELARRMDHSRYVITLGCLQRKGPLLSRLNGTPVQVVEFPPGKGMDSPAGLKQIARLAWFLWRSDYEVVHTHDLWSNLMGIPAARLAGVRVTICSQRDLSHDPWYRSKRERILRWLQRMCSAILTNAAAVREDLIQQAAFPRHKVRLVRNGVDIERFRDAKRERERLMPGAAQSKIVVLVGNMRSEVKGHATLIHAAPQVIRRFPQTCFVLVGEGELQAQFERQVKELGFQENFRFFGRRDDLAEILAASDVGVLPSKAEGMPNAILEYMAAGLPTVATAVGGTLDVIKDGVTGLLVPPDDPSALAAALMRVLGDEQLAGRLGREGQKFVATNFSFEKLVKDTDALYTELLEAEASGAN